MLGPGALAVVAVALLAGSFVNSLAGFGFALVTVPLMALAVGPKDAVVLSAVYGLLSNGGVALRHRTEVEVPVVRRLFAGSLVGLPVGLVVLAAVPATPLQVAISVTVLVSVVVMARGWVFPHPRPWVDVVAGTCSGVLNTSVGVGGPPVVMDLHGRGLAKGPFRASAAALFALSGAVALVLFAATGRLDLHLAVGAVLALPAWPLGAWAGERVHHRFPEERFRALVLGLLVVTAVVTLGAALAG
ncbi:MAG: sulfite exporter TauE/SafE family protein [Microthrixaceae bacterium]